MRHNSKIVKFSWSTIMSKTAISNSKFRAYVIVKKSSYKNNPWKNLATLQNPKNNSPGYYLDDYLEK